MVTMLPDGFIPIAPCGDSDQLAADNERMIIRFRAKWQTGDDVPVIIAPVGTLYAGWVIGYRPQR